MDEQYVRQNSIVERYLLDQLSDQEQSEFEQYYFEHPEIVKEIELARAMRDGLRSPELRNLMGAPVAAQQDARRSEPNESSALISWPRRMLDFISKPAWSAPVTAAAAIMAALLVIQPSRPPSAPLAVVAELELVRTRGEEPPEASVSRPGVVFFTVNVFGLDATSLKGTLRSDGRNIAELPLAPDPELDLAKVVLPATSLPPGAYTLELSDAQGEHVSYEFKITP